MGNGRSASLGQNGEGAAVLMLLLGCLLLCQVGWAQSSNAPVITAQPQSQFVLPATDVMFSVTATNPCWSELSTNSWGSFGPDTNTISDGLNIGRLEIEYDFYAIPDNLRAYYDDILVFDSGPRSGSGTITIDYGPGLSTNVLIVMNEGGNPDPNTAWDYTATASFPLAFQWLKGNAEIPLATNATYWITNVQFADAGVYSVVVTNRAGGTNSQPAYLCLGPPPTLAIHLTNLNTAILSWATNFPGFFLEKNSALDIANWIKVPNQPTVVGGQSQVTLPMNDESQLFRLRFESQ